MNEYHVSLKNSVDKRWLFEAALDLASATQNDLEELKKKKWYHRLIETVTFSKEGQIRTAKDISSVAKLQELVIRILVTLANENAEFSQELIKHKNILNALHISNDALRIAIEKLKFGGSSQVDFLDIGRDKKYIIANLLIQADPNAVRTEFSKQFIGSLLNNTYYIASDDTVKVDAVQSLNKYEQELLYRLIMVDRYLNQINYLTDSPVIDQLSVSTVRKNEILQSVQNTATVVSPEFFATFYEKQADIIREVDDSDIVFNQDIEEPGVEQDADELASPKEEESASKPVNENRYKKQSRHQTWELKQMEKSANKAVSVAVGTTAATCAIPIPFADAPILITEQVALLTTICGIYKINIKKDGLKSLVSAAFGIGGATLIGRSIASSLFKLLPGVGSLAGGAISAGTASVVTLAMGKSFIEVCKATKLGIIREEDITTSKGKKMMQQTFKEQMQKAKKK